MKDSLGNIIYVGKSKNLKNRVSSYFQNSKGHSSKVIKLVQNLKDFDYITTDTEFEAFLLECKLIKEYKPPYNRLMKNPLSYTYVKISKKHNLDIIEVTSEVHYDDEALYFGPYTSRSTVERAIEGIKECYGLLCSNSYKKSSSPCLNYSLGLCIGICFSEKARNMYSEIINKLIKLLTGSHRAIIDDMNKKMNSASENFDFEGAAKYRDYIRAVNYLIAHNKVVEYVRESKNIILAEALDKELVKFFLLTGNKVLYSQIYKVKNYKADQLISELKHHVGVYFCQKNHPLNIVSQEDIDEAQIIYPYLTREHNQCKHLELTENCLNSSAIDKALQNLIFSALESS